MTVSTDLTVEQLLPLLQDPRVSATVHAYADTDIGANALHHTLGSSDSQALGGGSTFGFDDFAQAADTPNAPTGINVTSNTLPAQDGVTYVEAIISWTPVTGNTDGTSINADDLDAYLVSWRNSSPVGDWSADFVVDPHDNVAYFVGLRPGVTIDVRVFARNLAHNLSAPGYAYSQTLGQDLTPPHQPSKPVVASLFGGIRVQWDGLDSVGASMALDFDHVDVCVGTTSTFIPSDSNKVDSIPTLNGGAVVLSYTDYGTNHYVKFVAVDKSNNHSSTSVASDPVAARQGVDADFANVSATKITAGKLSVDVGLAGRLLIGPLDSSGALISPLGARLELRNDGIHLYNGSNVEVGTLAVVSGVPTINITGPIVSGGTISGATIVGSTIETSTGGKRVVIDGTNNEIDFYDSSGTLVGSIDGFGSDIRYIGTHFFQGNILIASGDSLTVDYVTVNATLTVANISQTGAAHTNTFAGSTTFNNTVALNDGADLWGTMLCHGNTISNVVIASATINSPVLATPSVTGSLAMGNNPINNVTQLNNGGGAISMDASLTTTGSITSNSGDIQAAQTVNLQNPPTVAGTSVQIGSGGRLNKVTSALKYKTQIESLTLDDVLPLLDTRPVRFKTYADIDMWGKDKAPVHWGWIAEEVDALGITPMVYYEHDKPEAVNYDRVGVALILLIKELRGRLHALENKK